MLHRITSYDCPVRTIEIARGFQQTVEVMEQSTSRRFAQRSSTAADRALENKHSQTILAADRRQRFNLKAIRRRSSYSLAKGRTNT